MIYNRTTFKYDYAFCVLANNFVHILCMYNWYILCKIFLVNKVQNKLYIFYRFTVNNCEIVTNGVLFFANELSIQFISLPIKTIVRVQNFGIERKNNTKFALNELYKNKTGFYLSVDDNTTRVSTGNVYYKFKKIVDEI